MDSFRNKQLFFLFFLFLQFTIEQTSMRKILFVCHGNICRSPMAEFIMKHLVMKAGLEDQYYIESAAVSREEIGNPIYPPAKRCLTKHNIPFDETRTARQVTKADYDCFDDIICMDQSNLHLIQRIIPFDPEGKIKLMMSFASRQRDVADPWYTGDFEKTYDDLIEGCQAYLNDK